MTFLVAEIGVNWDGDLNLAKEMIVNAKNAGCDAVKFQAFDERIVQKHPQKERLLKSSINKQNIEEIYQISKSIGIEWFATPMIIEAVDLLDPFVNRFKIRESDSHIILQNKENTLIKKVLNTEKEIIISTQQNPKNCKLFGNPKINWLYCVPNYPCDFSDIDFTSLNYFNGYSNHCPNIIAPITASILGTEIIEVHITSNKKKDFFDNMVSFDYDELNTLVKYIRDVEKIKK